MIDVGVSNSEHSVTVTLQSPLPASDATVLLPLHVCLSCICKLLYLQHFKDESQTALFKDPVRTAL